MRAFISYSINDRDQFVLTLLAEKLRHDGFFVTSGNNIPANGSVDQNTAAQISKSHLFIGLITASGHESEKVSNEWLYARQNKIPNLLLIEDSLPVDPSFKGNYVRFNRYSPHLAIDSIETSQKKAKQSKTEDGLAWLLGGAALLALVALLKTEH